MKKILVTGAFGTIGYSTLKELTRRGYSVTAFDKYAKRNKRTGKRLGIRCVWGDLRNMEDVQNALAGQDTIIHLGAIIPPLADENPDLAEAVNVGGTQNILEAMERGKQKLIYSSSVAVYGDRLQTPFIRTDDPLNPNEDDEYGKQKARCEKLIRDSGHTWLVMRLSAIFSPSNLKLKPLMFEMPLGTSMEICHADDVALALSNAVYRDDRWGKILHIAGGKSCRILYGDFLRRMFALMGVGADSLPDKAFRRSGYHCGFMDTGESQKYLLYQRHSLDSFLLELRKKYSFRRFLVSCIRPFAWASVMARSRYLLYPGGTGKTGIWIRLLFARKATV
jgi:nucleoside-diphosphate-sugar epimerase